MTDTSQHDIDERFFALASAAGHPISATDLLCPASAPHTPTHPGPTAGAGMVDLTSAAREHGFGGLAVHVDERIWDEVCTREHTPAQVAMLMASLRVAASEALLEGAAHTPWWIGAGGTARIIRLTVTHTNGVIAAVQG